MSWEIDGEPWPYTKLREKAATAKALAKRVEELEEIFYRVSVESVTGMPMVYDMAREIAERRAGRAKS